MNSPIKLRNYFLLLLGFILFFSGSPVDWGFYGHKKINEMAVYTLPSEMFGFYKNNIEFLIEHSVDPDKRRMSIKGEAECHYIDMDRYCFDSIGCNPFKNVPKRWTDAVIKYGEDSLRANGIVPWHVYTMTMRLTEAFKNEDVDRILRLSAEIGHYISDAHVPLHTTSNYNGQFTGQRGIHGFWESRLPELFEPDYDFFVGKATYISAPLLYIWSRVEESYSGVDTVLQFEAALNAEYSTDMKFSYESRGQANIKVYSEEYSRMYSQMLDNQVENRMRKAVVSVGSYWLTAWIDAGQPDLTKFVDRKISPEAVKEMDAELNNSTDSPARVREHDN